MATKKGVCEQCNKVYFNLCIHHKDRNHGNNDPSNLQWVCPECHGKEHGFEGAEASDRVHDAVDDINPNNIGFRLRKYESMKQGY